LRQKLWCPRRQGGRDQDRRQGSPGLPGLVPLPPNPEESKHGVLGSVK
jgi:hypothetical protein